MIGVSANTLGIGIAIRLRDQFTAQAQGISNQFNRMYGNSQRVINANLQASRKLGVGMMLAGGFAAKGMMGAVNAAANFEFVMKTIQGVTSATSAEIKQMSSLALKLGTESIYTADEVASAMEYMVRSGYKIKDVYNSIGSVVALGAAAGGKAIGGKGGIADLMTSILHQFNLSASMGGRVADILAKAANISSSDVEDLAQAMKYTAGTSKILNVSLEETAAMLAVMSNAGLKGGVAGRATNNMMIYLANALGRFRSQRQTDAFEAIGLNISDIVDGAGELKPVMTILDAFGRNLKRMPKVDQLSALNALFNIRGQRAMIPLLEKSLKIGYNFGESLVELRDKSKGYAGTISSIIMDTIKGDIMVLSDTWKTFQIEVGTTLGIIARPIARAITYMLNGLIWISKTPLGKPIIFLAAALSVALVVAGGLLVVFTTLRIVSLAQTVTAANMGRTLTWAWTSATAAALRYGTVANGNMLVNTASGVRWRNIATGRWAAGAGTAAAGGTAGKGVLGWISNLVSTSGILKGLGNILKGFGGAALFVVTITGTLMGFKDMLKLVVYGLGSFMQALWFVVDYISNLDEGPIDAYAIARDRFARRNENLIQSLGLRDTKQSDKMSFSDGGKQGQKTIGLPGINETLARFKKQNPVVNLNIDGKQVGKAVLADPYEEMRQLLQSKSN